MTFTNLDMNPQRDKIFELLGSKNIAEVKLGLVLCPKEPTDIIEMFKETVFLTPVMHYFFYIYAYHLIGETEEVKRKRHVWQLLDEGCHRAYSWGSTIRKDIEGFDEEDMIKISCRNYYKHSLNLDAFKRETNEP